MPTSADELNNYRKLYAFLGNSLLTPITRSATVGLDERFWLSLPNFGSEAVKSALSECASFAVRLCAEQNDPVQSCSVEFTHLFVGPPSPAAPPWETMYRGQGTTIGFGQATFQMRELLRSAHLMLCNQNHQYEDHRGIELLYLSDLHRRWALQPGDAKFSEQVNSFINAHLLSWVDKLLDKVICAAPHGYFHHLIAFEKALLLSEVCSVATF